MDLDPARPDWRRAADYAHLLQLDQSGFAWEFLRRNHAYRIAAATGRFAERQAGRTCQIDLPASADDRWGLHFP